jgi:hypothetical protein
VSWWYARQEQAVPPASSAPLWAKAQAWEESPETRFQLGAAAVLASSSAPGAAARARDLRAALPDLEAALFRAPLSRRYNAFAGEDFAGLGSDAGVLFERARLLGR